MPFKYLPEVERCCGCVPDLKTATAIIAVLGIVTSPAVSWAVVRHTYVIRVSCFVNTNIAKPDIVDVNLNNVVSFGFGPNAGLGPTCLSQNKTKVSTVTFRNFNTESGMGMAQVVRWIGWVVLLSDIVLIICSINLLIRLFRGPDRKALKVFMITAVISMFLSFVYCMIYVSVCIGMGGAFPVFEFIFAFVDFIKWTVWIHYLLVIRTYYISYTRLQNETMY